MWCWRRLLRVPWTARRSNRSILKEISPEYSLEGLLLKLKFQYFGHLMRGTDSLENTLMLGKVEGRKRRVRRYEMVGWHHWLNGHKFEQALGVGDGQGSLECYNPWDHKVRHNFKQLNWTELRNYLGVLKESKYEAEEHLAKIWLQMTPGKNIILQMWNLSYKGGLRIWGSWELITLTYHWLWTITREMINKD